MAENLFTSVDKTKDELLKFFPKEKQEPILAAISIAEKHYEGQTRLNGDPAIIHGLATGYKSAEMGLGPKTVASGILHDVLKAEDTREKYSQMIKEELGDDVYELVDEMTRMKSKEAEQIGKFTDLISAHKYLLSSVSDLRLIMIKLAERYHNLLTIDAHTKEKQDRFIAQVQKIYTPIAEYLGLGTFYSELTDLLLMKREPEIYSQVKEFVEKKRKVTEEAKEKIMEELETLCEMEGIDAEIQGRMKSFTSIYKKQLNKQKEGNVFVLDNILDVLAFRLIVKTIDECYEVKSLLTSLYENVPEEEDDYIANPKPNGYRSIHLCLKHPTEGLIEVQIRTRSMHFYNELGPASHVAYKKSGKKNAEVTDEFEWIKQLHKSGYVEDEPIKSELFKNQIFVFTPDKDIIQLPKGATPLDFAYKVHTRLGNQCVGVNVNGKAVSLDSPLETGDVVDIRTDKGKEYASEDWLPMVTTEAAKRKIKNSLGKKRRSQL